MKAGRLITLVVTLAALTVIVTSIYEYLSAISCIEGPPAPSVPSTVFFP
jgi:hypothetical protein